MSSQTNLQAAVDRAKLMIKLSVISGILAIVLTIFVIVLGIINPTFAGSDVFALTTVPFTLTVLFSIVAMIYGMLDSAASLEDEEKYHLSKRRKDNRAFDIEEDVRFTSGRTLQNYKKYGPYVITVLAILIVGGLVFAFINYWKVRIDGPSIPANPLNSALISAILMLVSLFAGAFYIGQSRQTSYRWLRPVGSWFIIGFIVLFLAMISSVFYYYGVKTLDTRIAYIVLTIFGILGIEFIVSFIIEFYRPRTIEESRPLFESRLLTLFTEPGGVMRNMADALDYQFGFQVSGTWIYRFIERSLFPFIIFWAIVLWAFTTIYEVGPNEIGIKERFGKVVSEEPLQPGIYLGLPWPFGNINRYSCTEVKEFSVGVTHESDKRSPEIVLWTQEHAHEKNFLVAVQIDGDFDKHLKSNFENSDSVPLSFISLAMPVKYRIKESEIMKYAYHNRDSHTILQKIGELVATKYMASTSFFNIMSTERDKAAEDMKNKIQVLADKAELGVEIISVNILGAHPPIEKVAPEFQKVLSAMEEKESAIHNAHAFAKKTQAESYAEANAIIKDASGYKFRSQKISVAEADRFKNQLDLYKAMPSMFILNESLKLLEKDMDDIRKFVIASTLQNEVYELNFEQKERLDLIDTDLSSLTNEQ